MDNLNTHTVAALYATFLPIKEPDAAELHFPELKATYDKKQAEEKCYKPATIVVVSRVITIVYAVCKRSTSYRPKVA